MDKEKLKTVAIIVAHPDDESLWTGGVILSHPEWQCYIFCLSRKSDPDRSYRFSEAVKIYKAMGIMGDLDDGPEQNPLDEEDIENAILNILNPKYFDLIITHNPSGEYTRHIRHEEISKAVIRLWHTGKIVTSELWAFAYEDGHKAHYPKPIETANIYRLLSKSIWLKKYSIMTETYGFERNSWEAKTTPKAESFWQFTNSEDAMHWLTNKENR